MKTKTLDAIALGIVGGVVAAIIGFIAWSIWTTPGGVLLVFLAVTIIAGLLLLTWAIQRTGSWYARKTWSDNR